MKFRAPLGGVEPPSTHVELDQSSQEAEHCSSSANGQMCCQPLALSGCAEAEAHRGCLPTKRWAAVTRPRVLPCAPGWSGEHGLSLELRITPMPDHSTVCSGNCFQKDEGDEQ